MEGLWGDPKGILARRVTCVRYPPKSTPSPNQTRVQSNIPPSSRTPPITAMRCVYLFISTRNGSRFEKEFFQVSFCVCSFWVRTMMEIVHFLELVKFLKPQQKILVS